MESNRTTAVTAGVLFITASAASVVGTQLSQPFLDDADYLASLAAHADQVSAGALLELVAASASAGIAVSLYPVLRQWNVGLAVGSVVFRVIEAVMYTVGVVCLLSLLALSRQLTGSQAADAAAFRIPGAVLLALRAQVIVPGVLAFSVGALTYYALFYESRLIPRWLSAWGIVAIFLTMTACLIAWFSHRPLTTYTVILLPIAVQEMVLALSLIARGFGSYVPQPRTNVSAVAA